MPPRLISDEGIITNEGNCTPSREHSSEELSGGGSRIRTSYVTKGGSGNKKLREGKSDRDRYQGRKKVWKAERNGRRRGRSGWEFAHTIFLFPTNIPILPILFSSILNTFPSLLNIFRPLFL